MVVNINEARDKRLRAGLLARLCKTWMRRLKDKGWVATDSFAKQITAVDADHRCNLESVPVTGKRLNGRAKTARGRELLLQEMLDVLRGAGCEFRDGESGQEIRLAPTARADAAVVASENRSKSTADDAPSATAVTTPDADAGGTASAQQHPSDHPPDTDSVATEDDTALGVVASPTPPAADAPNLPDLADDAPGSPSANPAATAATAATTCADGAARVVNLPVRDLSLHAAASDVPAMRPQEWQAFLADVQAQSVRTPLTVQVGGIVLDGRHRLKAAIESGHETVPAIMVDLSPDEQVAHVYRTALLCRHLTDDQRAVIAARWQRVESKAARTERTSKAGKAGGRGRAKTTDSSQDKVPTKLSPGTSSDGVVTKTEQSSTRAKAAAQHGVAERKVRAAIKLEMESPDLASEVLAGTKTMRQARLALKPAAQPGASVKSSKKTKSTVNSESTPAGSQSAFPLVLSVSITARELVDSLMRLIGPAQTADLLREAMTLVAEAAEQDSNTDLPSCAA